MCGWAQAQVWDCDADGGSRGIYGYMRAYTGIMGSVYGYIGIMDKKMEAIVLVSKPWAADVDVG